MTDDGRISLDKIKYVEPPHGDSSHWLRAGDVIFNNTNSEELTGKTALFEVDVPCVPSNHITVLRPTSDTSLDSYWLAAQLRYLWTTGVFRGLLRRYVGQATVSLTRLRDLEIPLPPLEDQQAIAHVLRTVQRAKEATEQVISAARELKQSLMHDLIGSFDWEVRPLGDLARIERGKFSHRPRNDPAFYGGDVPFVQTGDVAEAGGRLTTYRQTLNEAGLAVSRVFPAGTIVITIAANIGHVGILEFDSAFPDSVIGITPTDRVSNEFLNYYLMTQQPEMDRIAPRGTQKNINIQFLKPWPVPVPPREVQEEIVSALSAVYHKIAVEDSRSEALGIVFDSLLHNLMTARLRVTDLEVSL